MKEVVYVSFEEAYEEFKIYAKKRHKKQSFECLHYNFNANILSYFKDYDLFKITIDDILKWQDFIYSKKFCNNHNKNLYGMLKSFFRFCHSYYNLNITFLSEILPFKERIEYKKVDFYTLDEFRQFIKGFEKDELVYKLFFEFMFFVGTRPGETMALKFSDIKDDIVIINKTIDEHGKREIGTPKTLSSNRTVRIDNKLKRHIIELEKYYVLKYGTFTFDYFVFGGSKPLAPTTINRYKKKACSKAKIRPITLHQFRHSHATLLFNNGIVLHEISKRLGHSKTSTTLDIYTHSSLMQEKRVLKTLNSIRFNFFECLHYNFKKIILILKHISMF